MLEFGVGSAYGTNIDTRRLPSGCCARAACGHAMAEPATISMKSPVALPSPRPGPRRMGRDYIATNEMGFGDKLHSSNSERPMSALGQKQTSAHVRVMSALPPKADIGTQSRNVRFVPKADILRGGRDWRYSITSSATARSCGGNVSPSAFAVLRLRTRSNLVGCSIGRSPGFAPARILATYVAAPWYRCAESVP